jgi:hypothetical protein
MFDNLVKRVRSEKVVVIHQRNELAPCHVQGGVSGGRNSLISFEDGDPDARVALP